MVQMKKIEVTRIELGECRFHLRTMLSDSFVQVYNFGHFIFPDIIFLLWLCFDTTELYHHLLDF